MRPRYRAGRISKPMIRPATLALAIVLSLVALIALNTSLAPLAVLSGLTLAPLVYLVFRLRPLHALAYSFIASGFVGSLTYFNIFLVEEFFRLDARSPCLLGGNSLAAEALVVPLSLLTAGLPTYIYSSCSWTMLLEGLAEASAKLLLYGLSSWLYFNILTVYLLLLFRTMPSIRVLAHGKFLALTLLLPMSLAARIIFYTSIH